MNAESYLALCFILFASLMARRSYKILNTSIEQYRQNIRDSIESAEVIYKEAQEKHEEAKKLFAQLDFAKKYIYEKEEREIQYDLDSRKKEFTQMIKIKQQQFEHISQSKERKLKQKCLDKLNQLLRNDFLVYVNEDKKIAEQFTNVMLKK